MVPATRSMAPRDAVGELGMVQLRNGRVAAYSYNEAQGVRLVSSPADATTAGRASGWPRCCCARATTWSRAASSTWR
jgi:hypothetical protein